MATNKFSFYKYRGIDALKKGMVALCGPYRCVAIPNPDYYLLESLAVNSADYTNDYEVVSDWNIRGVKAIGHRYTYGINLVHLILSEFYFNA